MVSRMSSGYFLVLTTCPDADTARSLAVTLVDEQLAACVNIVPGLRSVYRWKGNTEESGEILLLIKTTQACYPALERRVRSAHPYELPEMIAIELAAGAADYLAWIDESCRRR